MSQLEARESVETTSRWKPYPTYKDTGIGWLGEIPEHWILTPIRSFARRGFKTFTDGDWIESPFIRESGIRLIQTGNIGVGAYKETGFRYIYEETFIKFRCTEVFPNDILICRLADPVGRACLAPNMGVRMITSVDVCILKPRDDIDARFVVYTLSSEGYLSWMNAMCRGGTRDRISRSMLGAVPIQTPSLKEQRTIATFLDRETSRIETLIAKKQRQVELLQEKRTALISHAVTKGLNPGAKMKDSGIEWLGEIPEHWGVNRSKVLFQEVHERSKAGEEELLSVSHITGVSRRSEKNVYMFMAESLEGYKKCNQGDLVINTMWAWMGALGITPEDGIVSPSYNVYRLRKAEYDPWFYDYLFRTSCFIAEIICYSKGVWTSRLRLYPQEFFEICLPCPPLSEQKKIVAAIKKETGHYDAFQKKIEQSIEKLKEYRTALISAAVTGKIDVRKEVA